MRSPNRRVSKRRQTMKLPFFKKADILLLAVLILIGAGSLLLLKSGEPGSVAVVTVDGQETIRVPLTQDRWEQTVETTYGTNTLLIENGSISVIESDCRGGDCMRFSPINKAGQTIVCLPHHLSVTIAGGDYGPDVVVR